MGLADGIAWDKEYGRKEPRRRYKTVEAFIKWINKADNEEVVKLLEKHGFEFNNKSSNKEVKECICDDCHYSDKDVNVFPCGECIQWINGYLHVTRYEPK